MLDNLLFQTLTTGHSRYLRSQMVPISQLFSLSHCRMHKTLKKRTKPSIWQHWQCMLFPPLSLDTYVEFPIKVQKRGHRLVPSYLIEKLINVNCSHIFENNIFVVFYY